MLICRLPGQIAQASEQFRQNDLVVISVDIAQAHNRDDARALIRQAIISVIAAAWDLTANEIHLHTEKGQAPYLVVGMTSERIVYLSIAHEAKYALATICSGNRVGIDVVNIADEFEWKDTALLFLGEAVLQYISAKPVNQQFRTFLQAWARHEAQLKCIGQGMQEWSEELEQQLSSVPCEVDYVSCDFTYIVALARLQSDKHNPAIQ